MFRRIMKVLRIAIVSLVISTSAYALDSVQEWEDKTIEQQLSFIFSCLTSAKTAYIYAEANKFATILNKPVEITTATLQNSLSRFEASDDFDDAFLRIQSQIAFSIHKGKYQIEHHIALIYLKSLEKWLNRKKK